MRWQKAPSQNLQNELCYWHSTFRQWVKAPLSYHARDPVCAITCSRFCEVIFYNQRNRHHTQIPLDCFCNYRIILKALRYLQCCNFRIKWNMSKIQHWDQHLPLTLENYLEKDARHPQTSLGKPKQSVSSLHKSVCNVCQLWLSILSCDCRAGAPHTKTLPAPF